MKDLRSEEAAPVFYAAWIGMAWLGAALHGEARQGKVRRGTAGRGNARQGKAFISSLTLQPPTKNMNTENQCCPAPNCPKQAPQPWDVLREMPKDKPPMGDGAWLTSTKGSVSVSMIATGIPKLQVCPAYCTPTDLRQLSAFCAELADQLEGN